MTAPVSTPESRAAALSVFQGQVPCVFQLTDPSCPNAAAWLGWLAHEENTARCDRDEPLLLCDTHKKAIAASSHPFWRTWHALPPMLCDRCKTPLRLDRFEPLT